MTTTAQFNWHDVFESAAQHHAKLAMTRGWWQYARHAVQQLEIGDDADMWHGLRARVAAIIKEAGYRPEPHELQEMEPVCKSH